MPRRGANADRPRVAGAAQQAQQHGLGLVVERVAGRDDGRAEPFGRGLEARIRAPARAAASIDTRRVRASARHVRARDFDRQTERAASARQKRLVLVRLGAAQTVVDVNQAGDRGRRAPRRQVAQQEPGSATESAPPDTATAIAITRGRSKPARRESCAPTRASAVGAQDAGPEARRKSWCRCRDLNPGPCGYEPHALTN